ncbi:TATA box binding protein associated factor-domain-containing protein [Panaeolus papilionaceus]|nr:TATA box binding protein associated factor-domain-containing protein [Panaeolus papilionaceus]
MTSVQINGTKAPKAKANQGSQTGVYKVDSIKDIAESLNITISDNVASQLASDVEYRINQVIEEAARFMRHGRRTTMTTADIEQALRVINIEPLYGHSPYNPTTFRRALPFPQMPSVGPVYFVEDEEIDFDRVLREEKIALPKGVSWTAHWLAVEGVQPLIPENPPAIPRDTDADKTELSKINGLTNGVSVNGTGTLPLSGTAALNAAGKKGPSLQPNQQQSQQLVKQVLSRELQLYYARLTSSLLPPSSDMTKRSAALASLRHDAGLQALLPYLVRWVGEGVVGALKEGSHSESEGKVLDVLMDVIAAILENSTLFVEPYLHQILPPILSILLHSSLPPTHAAQLRTSSAHTLSKLLTQHSTTYPSLSPRIMKTLLLALISPGKSFGTREGAIRGLISVGKEAVRKGLVEGGGAKVVGSECASAGRSAVGLSKSVMEALNVLKPQGSDMTYPLNPGNATDIETMERLHETIGPFFAARVQDDAAWSREILGEIMS